jgi:hypothetical protein
MERKVSLQSLQTNYQSLFRRLDAIESIMSRKENMISFVLIRFVLMSGMVVGFSWYASNLNP